MDVGVFQETKVTEGMYMRLSEGCMVVLMPEPIQHQGGIVIFYRDSLVFAVKEIRQFGANFITCQMATGERCWYIVGCYLDPGDGITIPRRGGGDGGEAKRDGVDFCG